MPLGKLCTCSRENSQNSLSAFEALLACMADVITCERRPSKGAPCCLIRILVFTPTRLTRSYFFASLFTHRLSFRRRLRTRSDVPRIPITTQVAQPVSVSITSVNNRDVPFIVSFPIHHHQDLIRRPRLWPKKGKFFMAMTLF